MRNDLPNPAGRARPKVAFLGPEGSFTWRAARQVFGPEAHYVDTQAHAVASQVQRGPLRGGCEHGVLAMGNIKHGLVDNTFHSLHDVADIQVVGEVVLPVRFHLASGGAPLEQIRRVASHEVALSQCRNRLDRLERRLQRPIERFPTTSTSASADLARADASTAALCSIETVHRLGLRVLASDVQDHPRNVTVFYVLGLGKPAPPADGNKTLFLVELVSGTNAMRRLLSVFEDNGVEVTMLREQPIPNKSMPGDWAKAYIIECKGHITESGVDRVYRALRRVDWNVLRGRRGRLLGSFPAADVSKLDFGPIVDSVEPERAIRP